jgi:hypothetical protein
MMNFVEFAQKYKEDTLWDDASWRAYNIPAMVGEDDARKGARHMGFGIYEAFADIGSYFDMPAEQVKLVLGLWYVWRRTALGRMGKRILKKHARVTE